MNNSLYDIQREERENKAPTSADQVVIACVACSRRLKAAKALPAKRPFTYLCAVCYEEAKAECDFLDTLGGV